MYAGVSSPHMNTGLTVTLYTVNIAINSDLILSDYYQIRCQSTVRKKAADTNNM